MRLSLLILFTSIYTFSICINPSNAQTGTPTPVASPTSAVDSEQASTFTNPVNLSNSGAASQPRILASPSGKLQAFWIDKFDGLVTSVFDGNAWSPSILVPLPYKTTRTAQSKPMTMPTILEDAAGRIHAFYYGDPAPNNNIQPLLYSQMVFGTNIWSPAQTLAESAQVFQVATPPNGEVTFAYLRVLHTPAAPAGVYVKRLINAGIVWGPPVPVYTSIYYRLFTDQPSWINVSDNGSGFLQVVWQDRQGFPYYAYSSNNGVAWNQKETFGNPDNRLTNPRVASLDQSAVRIAQVANGGCALYQQSVTGLPEKSPPGAIPLGSTPTPAYTPTWDSTQRILETLTACPSNERFLVKESNNTLLWLWGLTSNSLNLAAWTPDQAQWTQPSALSVIFSDPDTGQQILLNELYATLSGDKLAIVGTDPVAGEVWVTTTNPAALDLAYSQPSPWGAPEMLSSISNASLDYPSQVGPPTIAMDMNGIAHIAWIKASSTTPGAMAVNYAHWDGQSLTRPIEIMVSGKGQSFAQPAIYADYQNRIHLAWQLLPAGKFLYSRAVADQATSRGGWLPTQTLPTTGLAGWPQLGMNLSGHLYLLYAVTMNEGRGVYLLHSSNAGDSWEKNPNLIFDAAANGWAKVDHPVLAISPDGALFVAWVRSSSQSKGSPEGIFYSISTDDGVSWNNPFQVADIGLDWPKLAIIDQQLNLLYAKLDEGSIFHRTISLGTSEQANQGWGTPLQVPQWINIASPFGLVVDSRSDDPSAPPGTLHLVGLDANLGTIYYDTWDGERWSRIEAFDTLSQPIPQIADQFQPMLSAATRPQGGNLAVTWWFLAREQTPSGENLSPALFFSHRQIPMLEINPPSPIPTTTITATPAISATIAITPTPTIVLSSQPPPVSNNLLPLLLGGGLAAVLVGVFFIAREFMTRYR